MVGIAENAESKSLLHTTNKAGFGKAVLVQVNLDLAQEAPKSKRHHWTTTVDRGWIAAAYSSEGGGGRATYTYNANTTVCDLGQAVIFVKSGGAGAGGSHLPCETTRGKARGLQYGTGEGVLLRSLLSESIN